MAVIDRPRETASTTPASATSTSTTNRVLTHALANEHNARHPLTRTGHALEVVG